MQDLSQELRLPMLKLVEALEQDMRDQLAVRRQDFDELRATVGELAETQKRTETEIRRLAAKQNDIIIIQLGKLVGDQLERRYREKAYAYFGNILRKAQAVSWQEVEAELEERLSVDEFQELILLDMLIRGRLCHQLDTPEVWLAMDVSAMVDRNDVKRARRRAALLRKAGYRAIPVVAGKVTTGGEEAAHEGCVLLMQDGRKQFWEETLAQALR